MPSPLIIVPSPAHDFPGHPENATRIPAIVRALESSALDTQWIRLEPQPATREEIARVHPVAYIDALERAMAEAPAYVDYAPTYIQPESFECARLAAGGAIQAVDAIMEGESRAAFALVRPPGHHATPTNAMGFCLFNNAAIAARHAQRTYGQQEVMIVDFDVHHGNGTQAAFYSDPSVLFISTHQHGIYPLSGEAEETGQGAGRGYTINVPLPAGAGDAAFERIMAEIVTPAADRFRPDVLLVSAGYDAHWRDPLAALQLSSTGYFRLVRSLRALAQSYCAGRMALVLEGGYDLEALAVSVVASLHALLGHETAPDPIGPAPYHEPDIRSLLDRIRNLHDL